MGAYLSLFSLFLFPLPLVDDGLFLERGYQTLSLNKLFEALLLPPPPCTMRSLPHVPLSLI